MNSNDGRKGSTVKRIASRHLRLHSYIAQLASRTAAHSRPNTLLATHNRRDVGAELIDWVPAALQAPALFAPSLFAVLASRCALESRVAGETARDIRAVTLACLLLSSAHDKEAVSSSWHMSAWAISCLIASGIKRLGRRKVFWQRCGVEDGLSHYTNDLYHLTSPPTLTWALCPAS